MRRRAHPTPRQLGEGARIIHHNASRRRRCSPPRHGRLDRRDVDLLHGLHGGKGALGGFTPGGDGVGQHARDDLPAQPPAVDAPAAFRRLPAIAYEWLAN